MCVCVFCRHTYTHSQIHIHTHTQRERERQRDRERETERERQRQRERDRERETERERQRERETERDRERERDIWVNLISTKYLNNDTVPDALIKLPFPGSFKVLFTDYTHAVLHTCRELMANGDCRQNHTHVQIVSRSPQIPESMLKSLNKYVSSSCIDPSQMKQTTTGNYRPLSVDYNR